MVIVYIYIYYIYIILMVALPNNTIRFSEAQMAKQILWAFLQSLRFGSNGFQKTDSKSLTPQYLWCTLNFEVVISNPIRKIQNSILLTILVAFPLWTTTCCIGITCWVSPTHNDFHDAATPATPLWPFCAWAHWYASQGRAVFRAKRTQF